jgi:hypothetical protein
MLNSYRDARLDELLTEAESVTEDTDTAFGRLTPEQINWQPHPEKWSVGQCFEHLMKTNGPYIPIFEGLLKGGRRRTLWERVPLLPGVFGPLIIKAVSPQSAGKVKARPNFKPASSAVDARTIALFLDQQRRLVAAIRAAGRLDLARAVVTSPVAGFVTYSALDAVRVVVAHERRHFLQAKRVTESADFPGAVRGASAI